MSDEIRLLVTLAVRDGDHPERIRIDADRALRDASAAGQWAVIGTALAPVQRPGNCAACGHLISLHGGDGCGGKVYPAHSLDGLPCPCEHTGAAYVAEYHRVEGSTCYRVIMADEAVRVVYVTWTDNGRLTAESFGGRPLPEVPADALTAVTAYAAGMTDTCPSCGDLWSVHDTERGCWAGGRTVDSVCGCQARRPGGG